MLNEIAKDRLDGMEGWTVEKLDLLAEFHQLSLGAAISDTKRVWEDRSNGSWKEIRRSAGAQGDHRLIAFLSEDDGTKDCHPTDECHYFLATTYQRAAKILRDCGVSGSNGLAEPDRKMFEHWLDVQVDVAVSPDALQEALYVPIAQGVTDNMLALLYSEYTPDELRESAKRESHGQADLMAIQEQREINAMNKGLKAQFGHRSSGKARIRERLKADLTIDLGGDPGDRSSRSSDRRLMAVSQATLGAEDHDRLMAEIEAEFVGWCRVCGTMPELVGCDSCRPRRHFVGRPVLPEGVPF